MSHSTDAKPNIARFRPGHAGPAYAFAFSFSYYYFGRSGRLPHAGWRGSA